MAFLLSYKPKLESQDLFDKLSQDGILKPEITIEHLIDLPNHGIHPAETIGIPAIGYAKQADEWAISLYESIINERFMLDYPVYSDVIHGLRDFFEVRSLTKYCKEISPEQFRAFLSGFFVLESNFNRTRLPFYSQLGKGGITAWSYDVFNFDFSIQDAILNDTKLSNELRRLSQFDVIAPEQAIVIGDMLKKSIPSTYELLFHIYDPTGYPDVMPFELEYHKIASLSNWFIFWGQEGHYFFKSGRGITLSLFKDKTL